MFLIKPDGRFRSLMIIVVGLLCLTCGFSQTQPENDKKSEISNTEIGIKPLNESVLTKYFDTQNGTTLIELVSEAVDFNQDLSAAKLEIDKAKARLPQAKLRPNPTVDFEKSSGAIVANSGDHSFTIGASLPIEVFGRRTARIEAAEIAIELSEAEYRNKQRLFVSDLVDVYLDTLGKLSEITTLEEMLAIDLETARLVQIRVNEGETAPLELNLLQAEVGKIRARIKIAEIGLEGSFMQLKLAAGKDPSLPIRLRETIENFRALSIPADHAASVKVALQNRSDLKQTKIEEQAAAAGLKLVRSESRPDLTAYSKYSQGQTMIGLPNGNFPQGDRSLAFGVSVGLPIFNRNQGAIAEAKISIQQARTRREYAEAVIRNEVISAYKRMEKAEEAVRTLETMVIPQSIASVETFRRVYELGEIKITDLIMERRRLVEAKQDLIDARTEKYKAQYRLIVALGANDLLPQSK